MPRAKKINLNKAEEPVSKTKSVKKRAPIKKAASDKAAKLISKEVIKDEQEEKVAKKLENSKNKLVKSSISSGIKKSSRKTKAKPVIIDIIEDEDVDTIDQETFFSDNELRGGDSKAKTKDNILAEENDLVEGIEEDLKVDLEEIATEVNSASILKEIAAQASNQTKSLNNVDRQQQFFSDLVSEIKQKKDQAVSKSNELEEEDKIKQAKKSIGLYRRLVWKFLVLVSFLAALVLYLSFSKLTIFITPKVEAMNDMLFLKIVGTEGAVTTINDGREQISGEITELNLEVNKIYRATGEEYVGEEVSGKVTLINNYIKDQSLVATTRLLSNDNKLFRIKNAVTIPAGGQVEVDIYADKIAPEMAINPTSFIIPGLWIGLQDKIYAESKEPFVYQQKVEKYVRASDIQLANQEASNLLLERAREFKSLLSQDGVLYQIIEPLIIDLSASAGDKVEDFTMTAKAKVVVISFSQADVSRLAVAKLNILVPDDRELADFKAENLTFSLENYNEDSKTATIKTSFSGLMVLKSNAEVIDRERLVNLRSDQIATYLREYPEIGSFELEFYPNFIKKAPHLVDRIQVKIKK